ncbi:hypothetical protein BGX38DRAFT_1275588 [Terfezia claveryi]|nr:hypothetical protein BGX38DRAFT_1275588 [Terfezia claveryi]
MAYSGIVCDYQTRYRVRNQSRCPILEVPATPSEADTDSDHVRDGRRVLQEIEVEMQEDNPGVDKENEEPLDETPRQPPYTQYEHSQPVQLSPSFATPPVIDVSRAPRQQQNSINQPLNLSLPAVGTINPRRTRWSKDRSTRRRQVRKQKRWQRQQEAQVIEEAAVGESLSIEIGPGSSDFHFGPISFHVNQN